LLTIEEAREVLSRPDSVYATEAKVIDGVEFKVFRHAPVNLAELYALSARHDDRTFIVYEDERYDFPGVRQRAANLAHALVHDFGIRKGDRVALSMRNYPEWCFTYVAATSIGAVIVPLNGWWTGPELAYGLEDSGAKVLVADEERLERVAGELSGLGVRGIGVRCKRELPEGVAPIAGLLEGDHALPEVEVGPEDDATIMYTSGSTGHPKGVVSTHRAVVSSVFAWEAVMLTRVLTQFPRPIVDAVAAWLAKGKAALLESPFPMPQRSMLVTLPLFHVTGCNVQFLPAFRNGRKIVMMHKWNPERALELIEREKITDFSGVPTMSWELINSPDFDKRDTSTLQSLSAGGAARPPEHVKKLAERGGDAQPSTGYGMTETNSLGAAIGGEDYLARPASTGRAIEPLVELRVIDEAGNTLGVDREGEVCIKSVTNMRGYWNLPEETAKTLQDGWIHTGDLGRIDEEGFLYITGRAKDLVIRGGENISCPEVEHCLYEHPAVFECAAYPVPDERLGEALAVTVMLREGTEATEDELKRHVGERLARFKVPNYVWIQREPLPRIASEKFDKRALEAEGERRITAK
jgi:long-chain acyl-CoA synthetase